MEGKGREQKKDSRRGATRKRAARNGDPRIASLKQYWLEKAREKFGEVPATFPHGAWGRHAKATLKQLDASQQGDGWSESHVQERIDRQFAIEAPDWIKPLLLFQNWTKYRNETQGSILDELGIDCSDLDPEEA